MTFLQFVFYIFSLAAIASGMMVVASKNPVHSVLFLVFTFVAMSGVWILLNAEFLALILVLVYVGAVMTLFLFVVMMLSMNIVSVKEGFVRYLPLGLLIVFLVVGVIMMVVAREQLGLSAMPAPNPKPADYSNVVELGSVLYTQYVFAFEIAAVLLLTAIVAAITLTHRERKDHKSQTVGKQIAVSKKDRLRIVDLPSEKKSKPI